METRIKRIDDMDKWLILKAALIEKGYKLWQTQYDTDSPEGYHVWLSSGGRNVEVVTYNKDVAADIIKSKQFEY